MKNTWSVKKYEANIGSPTVSKSNFTQVPNELLEDCGLSIPSRYLLFVLLKYMMQKDFCFPSQNTLAKVLGRSTRHIRNLLNELENNKYIRKTRSGFNTTNTYVIGSVLNWKSDSSHLGNEIPKYQGNTIPSKNMNIRIINKNNLIKINEIKRKVLDKIGRFERF